ncbi:DUF5960 family protein [Streptococcus pluranimalium]|uniref:DUF5960 family protein n=1 Tax=Streptococcus pluranimalium TaxID=82348 RepID=UPI003465AA9B
MNQLEFGRNELQLDYFSDSYRQFERDFYRYSALQIPLTFLTTDILNSMARSQKSYFKLNKENTVDNRDHYFIFDVIQFEESKRIKKFIYKKTATYLEQKWE